ncbi:hypothetical protein M885DRAFT_506081 [Pelagophyceae sp. CCMP2097]|nr:hypothetical protein M885DRAFT_506081 [Pelagophyceae sp. CCMP2097]
MFAQLESKAAKQQAFFDSKRHTPRGFDRAPAVPSAQGDAADRTDVEVHGVVATVFARRKLGRMLTILCCKVVDPRDDDVLEVGEAIEVVGTKEVSEAVALLARTMTAGKTLRFDGVFEAARNRLGRWMLRATHLEVFDASVELAAPSELRPKTERHEAFADWILATFGPKRVDRIVDVAGGKGLLSKALLSRGATAAAVVEPEERPNDVADAVEGVRFVRAFASEFGIEAQIESALDDCTIVVALHPDEATEAAVCVAAARKIPFAVVPCCVFPSLFTSRRQFWHCDPEMSKRRVKTHACFVDYLVQRAHALGCTAQTATLPFEGMNVVVYWNPAAEDGPAKKSFGGDAAKLVCAFLDVADDVVRGGVKTVAKEWAYAAHREVVARLDSLAQQLVGLVAALDAAAPAHEIRAYRCDTAPALWTRARCASAKELRAALDAEPALFPLLCAASASRALAGDVLRIFAAIHAAVLGPVYIGEQDEPGGVAVVHCERANLVMTLRCSG